MYLYLDNFLVYLEYKFFEKIRKILLFVVCIYFNVGVFSFLRF